MESGGHVLRGSPWTEVNLTLCQQVAGIRQPSSRHPEQRPYIRKTMHSAINL